MTKILNYIPIVVALITIIPILFLLLIEYNIIESPNNQPDPIPEVYVTVEPRPNSKADVTIEIKTENGTRIEFIPSDPKVIKDESMDIMYSMHDPLYYEKIILSSEQFKFAPHNYSTSESHKLSNIDKSGGNYLKITMRGDFGSSVDVVTMKYNNSTISENIDDLILEFDKKEKYDVKTELNDFADLTLIINECDQYQKTSCVYVNHMKFLKNHEKQFLVNYHIRESPSLVDLTIKPEIKYLLNSIKIIN